MPRADRHRRDRVTYRVLLILTRGVVKKHRFPSAFPHLPASVLFSSPSARGRRIWRSMNRKLLSPLRLTRADAACTSQNLIHKADYAFNASTRCGLSPSALSPGGTMMR
ncbi:hypothetical protein EVAR_44082_1 [Eumeta japonica]|uniref:Uncharacterized protein n=1 Tax=Eumeta variegata TaxID=151549 RepID=A0A4C1X4Y7_EUMVA|nr:hypothetical protein EVAR_44082_1 [Eumeta japonica]